MRLAVNVHATTPISKSIHFIPEDSSLVTEILAREIKELDVYGEGVQFKKVLYNYTNRKGTAFEDVHRLAQVLYVDTNFELLKLERFSGEYSYKMLTGFNQIYYVVEKSSGEIYRLDVQEKESENRKEARAKMFRKQWQE